MGERPREKIAIVTGAALVVGGGLIGGVRTAG